MFVSRLRGNKWPVPIDYFYPFFPKIVQNGTFHWFTTKNEPFKCVLRPIKKAGCMKPCLFVSSLLHKSRGNANARGFCAV